MKSLNAFLKPAMNLLVVLSAAMLLAPAAMAAPNKKGEEAPPPPPEINMGAPFRDGAVLQREAKAPVWGWSKPGTEVTVEFAGQKKSATAGQDGKWLLYLDPLKTSAEGSEMTIREKGGKDAILKDLLVGEVWMASGQSNMQWLASQCDVGRDLQKQIAVRVDAGEEKPPIIREAKITNFFAAPHPIEHATAAWNTNALEFSAVAYAFAYELFRELDVPIGILNCSFSQTSIQAWTPRQGFAQGSDEYTQAIHRKILESDPTTPEHEAAWDLFYQQIDATLTENKQRIADGRPPRKFNTRLPGIMNDNREATWLFNARLNPMIPYAIRGCIWNQGYANIHEGLLYYNNLHSLIRGWRSAWNQPDLPVYFHQFYCPGQKGDWDNSPNLGDMAEMRMGAFMARDIPHTGMASQIDIQGAIHYYNKALPGKRLALHALKNQYGKAIVSDGPMFKSYEVQGPRLIVTFDHAEGGLQVGETGTNSKSDLAVPTIIPNGDSKIKLFYLAGEDRVWHAATAKIESEKVILTAPGVSAPRGVSYATGGVGNQPNLYNQALLPASPFIYFDNQPVTNATWTDHPLKVAGVEPVAELSPIMEEFRKMPILSSQFVDNAVLQSDVPVTIWGAANVVWGEPKQIVNGIIKFRFNDQEYSIPVTPEMKEWSITLPPTKAGSQLHTLRAWLEIDGETVVERSAENVVFGDVYYVGVPAGFKLDAPAEAPAGILRAITRSAKGATSPTPRRFTVSTSTSAPDTNRFASLWNDAEGTSLALAAALAKDPARPLGLILMESEKPRDKRDAILKEWIAAEHLHLAPSLKSDYQQLATMRPGTEYFDANARIYVAAWQSYWSDYNLTLLKTKRVPDGAAWGSYPKLTTAIDTTASQVHNVLVNSFTPAALKGIIFLTNPDMASADEAPRFAEQMTALANGMKQDFGGEDMPFIFTIPATSLAPGITAPTGIKGASKPIEITDWNDTSAILNAILKTAY
ncbi:MAG: sialate O-acetylesterase [Luteolibacter sp.]